MRTFINENSKQLGHHFVTHSGKDSLFVRRDDFLRGSPENPWDEIIDEFSGQIGERVGPKQGLIVSDFSTTGKVERVASEIVLMGMKGLRKMLSVHVLGVGTELSCQSVGHRPWVEARSCLNPRPSSRWPR